MKYILFLFLFCIATPMISQTKLINHKSHSGTNQTFNPQTVEGNFGLPPTLRTEINKNEKSKYKLFRERQHISGKIVYLLYGKKKLQEKNSNSMTDTKLLLRLELGGEDSKEFEEQMKKMIIKKLKEYRRKEKS